MEQVASQGRTVIFVSHSMPAVSRLCQRVILMKDGRVAETGTPHRVISSYLSGGGAAGGAERFWDREEIAPGDDIARLHSVQIRDGSGDVKEEIDILQPVDVDVRWWNRSGSVRSSVSVHFYNDEGVCLFVTCDYSNQSWSTRIRRQGLVRSVLRIPGNFLAEGRISVLVAIISLNPTVVHALERDAVAFYVADHSEGKGVRGQYTGDWPGVIRPLLEWELDDSIIDAQKQNIDINPATSAEKHSQ